MKKANTQLTLKSLAKYVGLVAATVFVFSCGKNSNNDQQINNGVFQNCASCAGLANGQSIYNSKSIDSMYGMAVNLNFIGSAGYSQYNQYQQPYTQQYPNTQYNQYGTISPFTYSGSVGAQGQLQITQTVSNSYGYSYGGCQVPAGTYSLDTVQAGQWNQGIVTGLVLQGNSGAAQVIILINAQMSANKIGLFGNMTIQSVNGMNCNISTLIQ